MAWQGEPPNLFDILSALIISTISAFVSISRRILKGYSAPALWIISEFLMAILCGYLVYVSFPDLTTVLPDWVTLPIAVAVAAHIGGRFFQELETIILARYTQLFRRVGDRIN